MYTEPARLTGVITSVVAAVVTLVVVFGLSLTIDQQAAILGLTAVVAPVVAGYIIREKVNSPATAEQASIDSAETGQVDPNNLLVTS